MICRDAAELISRALDERLAAAERLGLTVHTLFCGPCRRFRGQLARLDVVWRAAAGEGVPPGGEGLSAAARERITTALAPPPPDGGTGLAPGPGAG